MVVENTEMTPARALLLHPCFVRLIVSEVNNQGHLAPGFDVTKKYYNLNFTTPLKTIRSHLKFSEEKLPF